ncbi:putative RTA1 domain protein [Rhexocercosporidium sp. MPI-PUGE-AT-0058]|nr:putative RTA1 domain protein [Rhexocercosporidium sp. MPI-PUGE-AT-0058]
MPDYSQCTHVTPQCPVGSTTYGYYPNLPGNIVLCLGLSIKGRTWTWLIGLFIGCGLEFAGYIGRILMHSNPWSSAAFRLQIVALILGPSFVAAGIDLTLKHLVINFGPQYSLIKPVLYTWLFIGFDIFSILLQAAGGGLAASGESNPSLLDSGNNLILAGIALQVAQLGAFGIVSVYYAFNVYRHRKDSLLVGPGTPASLKYFMSMIVIAYVFILLRCIYRIPEMAGGWGSALQRDEPLFLGLDGAAVAIVAIALTAAHPTIFFPVTGNGRKGEVAQDSEK